MEDIEILRSGEYWVAHVEGHSEQAVDFIDAYIVPKLIAVDSGRIILSRDDAESFKAEAQKNGLSIVDGERL